MTAPPRGALRVSLLSPLLLAACYAISRPGGELAPSPPVEFRASFPMPSSHDSVWTEVFIPTGVRVVRGVVAFIDRELDRYAYDDRDWRAMCARAECALLRLGLPRQDGAPAETQLVRNAARAGDAALLRALVVAAGRTAHPELRNANVLLFGHSAAGSFAVTFAAAHPDRTIGFIRYHTHLRGLVVDTAALVDIPALTIAGARDETAGQQDSRALWRELRARGAPWAYVGHIGQPHHSVDGLVEAGPLMRDWTEAVLRARTWPRGGAAKPLTPLRAIDGWLADDSTGEVAPAGALSGPTSRTSWLPNARTAVGLRLLAGMCASATLPDAASLLGSGVRLDVEDASVCHYLTANPRRDLWISANRLADEEAARAQVAQAGQAAKGRTLTGLGDAAFFAADEQRGCSTVATSRSAVAFYVSLCGAGFGVPADSGRVRALAIRVVGLR